MQQTNSNPFNFRQLGMTPPQPQNPFGGFNQQPLTSNFGLPQNPIRMMTPAPI